MSTKTLLGVLQGAPVYQFDDARRTVKFTADIDVDADGANGQNGIWAYRPGNSGIEDLANAGYPDHPEWYRDILVCDPKTGKPIVINGGYVSKTAYEWRKESNPLFRYVDASHVPYIVVSGLIRKKAKGVILGCAGKIFCPRTGLGVLAGVIDIGPLRKVGEGSCAAVKAIGLSGNPRNGGTSKFEIDYEIYPDEPFVFDGVTYDLIRA